MLTGGGSTRLGQDKATVVVAGRRMIDRVLDQIPADVPVVVVGPDPGVQRSVQVTREDPPGGGPVAAIGHSMGGCIGSGDAGRPLSRRVAFCLTSSEKLTMVISP